MTDDILIVCAKCRRLICANTILSRVEASNAGALKYVQGAAVCRECGREKASEAH